MSTETPQWSVVRNSGTWVGDVTADLRSRDFVFRSSEPVSQGGKDDAPNPMELLLGAVNGCVSVVAEIVAEEQGVSLTSLETEAAGKLDGRGIAGVQGVSPAFQEITLDVTVGTDADDEQFATFQREVIRRCPAMGLLYQTDATVTETWHRA